LHQFFEQNPMQAYWEMSEGERENIVASNELYNRAQDEAKVPQSGRNLEIVPSIPLLAEKEIMPIDAFVRNRKQKQLATVKPLTDIPLLEASSALHSQLSSYTAPTALRFKARTGEVLSCE